MAFKPFREIIKTGLIKQLSERGPLLSSGFKRVFTIATAIDGLLEAAAQGRYASMPGRGTPSALGMIGRDRMLIRGPLETDEGYAARLRGWLDQWRIAGSALSLMLAIRAYLAPNAPLLRVYLRSGFCWTLELDGTLSWVREAMVPWDWDSISNPERDTGYQTDIWVIIYPPHYPTAGLWGDPDSDVWGGESTTGDGVGAFGFDIPAQTLSILREVVMQFKGPHCYVRSVIFSGSTTLFDPINSNISQMPDGRWGTWSRNVGGTQVPTRRGDCRYWEPTP